MNLAALRKDLQALATKERQLGAQRYFKTGPGEYGEGDTFIGVTVPDTRKIAKQYRDLDLVQLNKLAGSKIHEERLCALHILNYKYSKAKDDVERVALFELWLNWVASNYVNNWDLIDSSAPYLGDIFSRRLAYNLKFLRELAKSENLWERRAAIMLTFPLIRAGNFEATKRIALDLISDEHDLIHKASGWMLREMGNKDGAELTAFLVKHKSQMPRTMLRYAIEKYTPHERAEFLAR